MLLDTSGVVTTWCNACIEFPIRPSPKFLTYFADALGREVSSSSMSADVVGPDSSPLREPDDGEEASLITEAIYSMDPFFQELFP